MQRLGYKIAKWLMIIMATLQLALSQIHIKAISIVFVQSVGFYLFLFILFGLLVMFTLFSTKSLDKSNMFKIISSSVVTGASGIYTAYLIWSDFKSNDAIVYEDIEKSLYLLLFGAAIYLIGTIVILGISLSSRKGVKA
jgi:hypothetical protein